MNGESEVKVKPKVLIDVALLGEAHYGRTHARGVHRVAEELVSGLVSSNQCELRFVATSHLASAYRWLEERGLSPQTRLFYGSGQMRLSRWAERASRWVERTLPDRQLRMRGMRWLWQRFAVWANATASRIPSAALRGIDIYHSPLKPIPESVQATPGIRQFLTVVDVIPLTNPESVGGRGVALLQKQLNSVKLDQYIFAISETVKSELLEIKEITDDHVFVTPLAASARLFHPVRDRAKIQRTLKTHDLPDKPYFLTLSSFDPRKNFPHIIRCFRALMEQANRPDVNLVIVGSNPERNAFVDEALADASTVADRIFTPGYIPDDDLAPVYSGSLAFLFPSLSEGFGMPVLEAMNCGTPVISSNAPALPEIVADAGLLLDPADQKGWVEAMARVAESAECRTELSGKGLRRAAGFSWQRFIEATLKGYRASCSNSEKA